MLRTPPATRRVASNEPRPAGVPRCTEATNPARDRAVIRPVKPLSGGIHGRGTAVATRSGPVPYSGTLARMVMTITAATRPASVVGNNRVSRALISITALVSTWTGIAIGGINLSDIFLTLTLLVVIHDWLLHQRDIRLKFWMIAPTLAVVFITANAVILLKHPLGSSVEFLVKMFLSTCLVAVLVQSDREIFGAKRLTRVLGWWAAGAGINALAAILTSVGVVSFEGIVEAPQAGTRAFGLAFHPNSLAFSIVIAIPVMVYFWVSSSMRRSKWAAFLGLAACFYALVLVNSRGGLIVGLTIGVLSLAVAIRASRARALAVPLALTLGVALFVWVIPLLGQTRLAAGAASGSDALRAQFAADAFQIFAANPVLGAGIDSMAGVAIPLNVLSSGGLFFAVFYYLFVFAGAFPLWRNPLRGATGYGLLVLMSILAFGMFGNGVVERATFWPLLLLAGIAVAASAAEKAGPAREEPQLRTE